MSRNGLYVIKRDGCQEPFSIAKLRSSLTRVMRVSECDPKLAEPLAKAVLSHLDDWQEPQPPTTDYVFRCAKAVLEQTGLEDAAREFARQRRIRDERRKAVRIVDRDTPSKRFAAWRKSEVVRSLKEEYGIGHAAARFLAGRTEEQIFALNYKLVSRTLVSELLRNELHAWGLSDERLTTPNRTESVG